MRDDLVDAVRPPGTTPGCARCWSPAPGTRSAAGMDLRASTVAAAGGSGFDPRPPARRCARACRRSSGSCGSWTSPRSPPSTARRWVPGPTWPWRATSCSPRPPPGSSGPSPAGVWWSMPAAPTCCRGWSGCRGPRPWCCWGRRWWVTEAVELGLAYRCLDSVDELTATADELAVRLAAGPDPVARAVQAAAERQLRDHLVGLAGPRGPLPGTGHGVARDGRGHGRVQGAADAPTSSAPRSPPGTERQRRVSPRRGLRPCRRRVRDCGTAREPAGLPSPGAG